MTSSEKDHLAQGLLDEMLGLLAGKRIGHEIDEPIEDAAGTFRLETSVPISAGVFNRLITAFVRHLYLNGVRLSRALSEEQALGEALSVLDSRSADRGDEGYEAALLDAGSDTLEGLETVLSRVAERVKEIEREKYVRWVLVSRYDPSDWESRVRIAAAYLKRFERFLPPPLAQMGPARLANEIEHLILSHLPADELVQQALGRNV